LRKLGAVYWNGAGSCPAAAFVTRGVKHRRSSDRMRQATARLREVPRRPEGRQAGRQAGRPVTTRCSGHETSTATRRLTAGRLLLGPTMWRYLILTAYYKDTQQQTIRHKHSHVSHRPHYRSTTQQWNIKLQIFRSSSTILISDKLIQSVLLRYETNARSPKVWLGRPALLLATYSEGSGFEVSARTILTFSMVFLSSPRQISGATPSIRPRPLPSNSLPTDHWPIWRHRVSHIHRKRQPFLDVQDTDGDTKRKASNLSGMTAASKHFPTFSLLPTELGMKTSPASATREKRNLFFPCMWPRTANWPDNHRVTLVPRLRMHHTDSPKP
jgi:hypothetical protein